MICRMNDSFAKRETHILLLSFPKCLLVVDFRARRFLPMYDRLYLSPYGRLIRSRICIRRKISGGTFFESNLRLDKDRWSPRTIE